VELVSAEGAREVVSGTGGLALRATAALDPGRAGLILVPGASGRVGEPGDVPGEDDNLRRGSWQQDAPIPVLLGRTLTTELPALLKAAMDHPQITVCAVVRRVVVLAMAGLLEGRHATTHHLGLDLLDATGAHAVHARVVDDGRPRHRRRRHLGTDLGLYLLEREVGPRIAHAVEELFAHERRGTVWRDHGPVPAGL